MIKAYAVIGSNWGDEGKGNVTDILCSKNPLKTINVRINGGAQASHTVVTPDGKRHAFSHFGSGSFAGSPTYLSKEFLVNLFSFDIERCKLLEQFDIKPVVCVNPECRVTTFWDMNINQMIENIRGENRHGSCGFGINETVHRSKYDDYKITIMDLFSEDKLRKKLEHIQRDYVPMRLKNKYNLILDELPKEYAESFNNPDIIQMTMEMAKRFIENVTVMDDCILSRFDIAVFEGAQGLLLDQGFEKFWPNVTTSNTGVKNMVDILKAVKFDGEVEVYNVSRCYATRHGRGKFPTETAGKPYKNIVDLTNIPNEFQEHLRFGILDMDLLLEALNGDYSKNYELNAKRNMVFTCFDQLDDVVFYKFNGKKVTVSKQNFLEEIKRILCENTAYSINDIYVTTGEARDKLIKI